MAVSDNIAWRDFFLKLVVGFIGISIGMLGFLLSSTYTGMDRRIEENRQRIDISHKEFTDKLSAVERQVDKAVSDSSNSDNATGELRRDQFQLHDSIKTYLERLSRLEVYVDELLLIRREERQQADARNKR